MNHIQNFKTSFSSENFSVMISERNLWCKWAQISTIALLLVLETIVATLETLDTYIGKI